METESKPIVFAHRGASGYEYENSMPAFEKAIELGADGLRNRRLVDSRWRSCFTS